jgi:hypothetical protein
MFSSTHFACSSWYRSWMTAFCLQILVLLLSFSLLSLSSPFEKALHAWKIIWSERDSSRLRWSIYVYILYNSVFLNYFILRKHL